VRLWSWDQLPDNHNNTNNDNDTDSNCGSSENNAIRVGSFREEQTVFCPGPALCVDWHEEQASLLAIGTAVGTIKLWDCARGAEAGEIVTSEVPSFSESQTGVSQTGLSQTGMSPSSQARLPFVVGVRFLGRGTCFHTQPSSYGTSAAPNAIVIGKQRIHACQWQRQ